METPMQTANALGTEATVLENKTPSKTRSLSDPPNNAPNTLQPSPTFHERQYWKSKDDEALLPTTPKPSRRPDFVARGLSLQMPPRLEMPSPSHFPPFPRPAPLSPQLDRNNIFGGVSTNANQGVPASPVTSLPRHSRGLDFARACTNLHHSTIAESSPDSSPVITQKAMNIPGRKGSMNSMMLDSPNINGPGSVPWSSLVNERSTLSSSVGSVNMLASESEDSDSDDDASMGGDDNEDPIFTTPQVHKLQNPANAATPFTALPSTPSGGGTSTWGTGSHFSPAQASLMKTIRRTRLQKNGRRSRKSSSSASGSGYSSMASPRTTSPPPLRSIESTTYGGYFNVATAARSRRESLALGTDGLHISSGNDSGDEASQTNTPSTPGVVRRPVVRRGNLLPKTKGFARIRAALAEEAAPIDTEVRREAETIRQVRERDGSNAELDLGTTERPQTATAQSSPSLLPAVPESAQEDFGKDLETEDLSNVKGLGMDFAAHASRNSGGMDYWHKFDPAAQRTPPPPPIFARHSSSAMSDVNMDSEVSTGTPLWRQPRPRGRSSASDASDAFGPNGSGPNPQQQPAGMNDDMHLKKFKRRREDDFDISTIKRRAVSPGMSAQNSPVLTQSPSSRDANAAWGQPPERKDNKSSANQLPASSLEASQPQGAVPNSSQQSSRHGSSGSGISMASGSTLTPSLTNGSGGKKLGLQGMVDTNDGIMKMSIE